MAIYLASIYAEQLSHSPHFQRHQPDFLHGHFLSHLSVLLINRSEKED